MYLEQECYENFEYVVIDSYFHSFEVDDKVIGLCFAEGFDAAKFKAGLFQLITTAMNTPAEKRATKSVIGKPEQTQKANNEAGSSGFLGFFGGIFGSGKKESKADQKPRKLNISEPKNVVHMAGFGNFFGIQESETIPEEWLTIFRQAGVSEDELKDKKTAKFLMKTIVAVENDHETKEKLLHVNPEEHPPNPEPKRRPDMPKPPKKQPQKPPERKPPPKPQSNNLAIAGNTNDQGEVSLPPPPPTVQVDSMSFSGDGPPPPPPPPPPLGVMPKKHISTSSSTSGDDPGSSSGSRPTNGSKLVPPGGDDNRGGRGALLEDIRNGIKLNHTIQAPKVETMNEEDKSSLASAIKNAMILRREAVEEDDDDEDDW